MSPRGHQPRIGGLFWLILGLYALLAVACSVVNPIFEAPDEQHHYFTARQIATTGQLPVASADSVARQEAAQPPLYYVISALILAPTDTSLAAPSLYPNPNVSLGNFESVTNFNAFAHTPSEAWPWRGSSLGVHALRFLSIAFGLGTLACIFASGRLLWPRATERSLLATSLVAFLPQYIFLHSAVTNDTLIIFLCSAALWQMIRLWLDQITPWRFLLLGITIGLAALSKNSGLLLLVSGMFTILFVAWRGGRWGQGARNTILLIAPIVLMSGWMYVRNWMLYGDALAVNAFVELAGGDRQFTVHQALSDLDRVWQSSIAVFGWMNVTAPTWVYSMWRALVALGVLGYVLVGVRWLWGRLSGDGPDATDLDRAPSTHNWLLACLLALWPLLVFGAWLQFAMRTPADQGRLLFAAILPVALALAYGLSAWSRRWSFPVVAPLALVTAVYCVFFLLPGTYVQPEVIEAADIPPSAVRLNQDMGLGIELVASEVSTLTSHTGGEVDLTLYWLKSANGGSAVAVVPKILGREFAYIGGLPGAYQGGGLYPSTLWPVNGIVEERLRLPLKEDAAAPTQARLYVALDGQSESLEIGSIKVVPRAWPRLDKTALAQLGQGIAITEAVLDRTEASHGATVPVRIRWQIAQAPGKDLTTFVHLGEPTQPPLAQADGPALGGDYPSGLWADGEVFDDMYVLQVPADAPSGRYPVHVGLYDPGTGERLPLWIDDARQPYDAPLVGWLTVQ